MKKFYSKRLGISLSYPETWQEIPGPWINTFLGKAKLKSVELEDRLKKSQGFILVVHDCEVQLGLAYPTLKCRVYDMGSVRAGGGVKPLLSQLDVIGKRSFSDFEVNELNYDYIVAGVVGSKVVCSMSIFNEYNKVFPTMTESYYLPTRSYLFCISLSATSDMAMRPNKDFEKIVKSIQINKNA